MAKPPIPTKTIAALHFEDLEPHRFEDLVRQLIYDFKPWRQLEATGRLGADEGFDVRGFENGVPSELDDDEENAPGVAVTDRVWLIQCKREKSIGPKKLGSYVDALGKPTPLHGIILAAACDFSKTARDLFRERTRSLGVAEAHLWGKAEVEDMLVQPKNDHLLFAYFGISLQVRQRSLKTAVRTRIATKLKLQKCLDRATDVLVRDAGDQRYPWQDKSQPWPQRRKWSVFQAEGCKHDGLHLLRQRCLAFVDDAGEGWDYAEAMNVALPYPNPWLDEDGQKRVDAYRLAHEAALAIWESLPIANRGWLRIVLVLPYDNILAIDEGGDEWYQGPHVYTTAFLQDRGPFLERAHWKLDVGDSYERRRVRADRSKRVNKFARIADAPGSPIAE